MGNGYVAPAGDQYDSLVIALRKLAERLSELETPTGTSMNSLVQQVQQAIADIGTTISAWLDANLAAEVAPLIANPGAIAPTTVTASSSGSFGGDLSTSGQFHCLDAYNFDITYTRRTAWWGNDGRAGFASSSREKKTAIRPAGIDVDAVLSLVPKAFEYRAQHAWREIAAALPEDDPRYNPDYQIPTEVGLIAEELVDAGLGQFVFYDENGTPEGIEYSMLVVPLLAVTRAQASAISDLSVRLVALEATSN